jgi:hypothetical protein
MSASLQGLSVIRAFKAEKHLQRQFDNLQNLESSVYYLYKAVYYSFAFWTDITCACYASILVFYLFFFLKVVIQLIYCLGHQETTICCSNFGWTCGFIDDAGAWSSNTC